MLTTYSFLNIFYTSQQKNKYWGSNKKANLPFLENYVSRSELWANGKMTICSFDNPIFNTESGTFYI